MLKDDLLRLIEQGEGAKLEFKRDDVRPEHLAREIVGFANMNGGRILMGVDDDGSISGVQKDNLQEWLMDAVIGRHVNPYIHPDYDELSIGGARVAVVSIPMGAAKPYLMKHNDREDLYVRYGNVCRLADRVQQARLYASGGFFSAEKFPVPGGLLSELSAPRYRQYFSIILQERAEVDAALLRHRYFLVESNGEVFCSCFAYALFGKKPGLRLPQTPARIIVYPGADKDYNTMLDETLDAPYVELRSADTGEVVEQAMHQRIINTLRPHISREKLIDSVRKRVWDYPEAAIREAVVNALIHRDWTKPDYVRLEAYSDRLEISSPGAPPNGITIENIKGGARLSRNQQFVNIFRDYGYLEDRGMGIRCKIIPLSIRHNGREPDFEATEDHFKITLHKKPAP